MLITEAVPTSTPEKPKHTPFTVFYEKSGETPEKQKPL